MNTLDSLYSKEAEDNIISILLCDDTKVTNILSNLKFFNIHIATYLKSLIVIVLVIL